MNFRDKEVSTGDAIVFDDDTRSGVGQCGKRPRCYGRYLKSKKANILLCIGLGGLFVCLFIFKLSPGPS